MTTRDRAADRNSFDYIIVGAGSSGSVIAPHDQLGDLGVVQIGDTVQGVTDRLAAVIDISVPSVRQPQAYLQPYIPR